MWIAPQLKFDTQVPYIVYYLLKVKLYILKLILLIEVSRSCHDMCTQYIFGCNKLACQLFWSVNVTSNLIEVTLAKNWFVSRTEVFHNFPQ